MYIYVMRVWLMKQKRVYINSTNYLPGLGGVSDTECE